jgi:4-amino-4-deoxy-L-arabinose transferase-like glycosyltransferase
MRRWLVPTLVVFALALAVRLLYVWQLHGSVVFDLPMGDGLRYDTWARQIAGGAWLGDQVFYQAPLYPYVLAVQYALFGHDLLVVRVVQAVLGAAACGLITAAGIGFFDRRSGVLAGVILSLYPSALFFDGLIQKSALDTFLLACVLASMAWAHQRTSWRPMLALGAALGLLVLTRENALVLAPVLLAWIALRWRDWRWPRRAALAAALLAGMLLVLLPVAARNAWVGGEFHLTTSQLGPNFYIGNGAGATGVYRALVWGRGDPMYEQRDAVELAQQATGRSMSGAEVSRYWLGRALADIAQAPARWLGLMGYKTLLLVNATEMVDTEDQYTYADWSWLLRLLNPVLHLGVLLPAAVFAWVWMRWQWRAGLPLAALAIVYGLSVVAFYVMARYRFPLVPLLALIAGWGLADLSRASWPLKATRVVPALAAGLVAAIVCNWPLHDIAVMKATTHYSIGVHLAARDGATDAAISHLRQAVALHPTHSGPRLALAQLLAQSGREADAVAAFDELIALHPRHVLALHALATLLLDARDPALRDPARALTLAQQAVAMTGGKDPALVELADRARRAAGP